MQINKKGLLYRLALWGTIFKDHEIVNWSTGETDICSFTRKVLLGLFWFIPLTIITGTFIGFVIGLPFFFLALWIISDILIVEFWLGMAMISIVIFVVFGLLIAITQHNEISNSIGKLTDKSKGVKEFKEFVKTNYDAWHDKTCFIITTKK